MWVRESFLSCVSVPSVLASPASRASPRWPVPRSGGRVPGWAARWAGRCKWVRRWASPRAAAQSIPRLLVGYCCVRKVKQARQARYTNGLIFTPTIMYIHFGESGAGGRRRARPTNLSNAAGRQPRMVPELARGGGGFEMEARFEIQDSLPPRWYPNGTSTPGLGRPDCWAG